MSGLSTSAGLFSKTDKGTEFRVAMVLCRKSERTMFLATTKERQL